MEDPMDHEVTECSIPLPRSLDTRVHIRLQIKSKVIIVFLTTTTADEADQPVPMGSFVYALPDRYNPDQPLSTTIFSVEATLDFTTRIAKILAKKTHMPVYVGNSMSFSSTSLGGTEEMEAFLKVAKVLTDKLRGINMANGVDAS
ncbi:Uu.00g094500.m01.CDS01 [Anthostomella pinea]|uniref:Uu.00g094500.m01.CDS01 n=1 Tax=Anthostomella pinea TaxID=933095 RepID=A0AAI8YI97_9PEZI|nr:Uu.00g094500.m01.CDS01 [Anthostomella pinea]